MPQPAKRTILAGSLQETPIPIATATPMGTLPAGTLIGIQISGLSAVPAEWTLELFSNAVSMGIISMLTGPSEKAQSFPFVVPTGQPITLTAVQNAGAATSLLGRVFGFYQNQSVSGVLVEADLDLGAPGPPGPSSKVVKMAVSGTNSPIALTFGNLVTLPPLITDGVQLMNLNYQATSLNNFLNISARVFGAAKVSGAMVVITLVSYQDPPEGAKVVAAGVGFFNPSSSGDTFLETTVGIFDLDPHDYEVRGYTGVLGQNFTLNETPSGLPYLGGLPNASMTITEYDPN